MQRVSTFLPSWDRRNSNSSTASKSSSLFGWAARNSASVNKNRSTTNALGPINVAAANGCRVQREAFWPSTLDMECVKAARILKSFCTDGYLAPAEGESLSRNDTAPNLQSSLQVMKKIPQRIVQNAAGIAVFTCMRSGLWMTGSGGSGILIARKSDGTWSPPSGIMLHTPTLSFIIGVDAYDCVLVVTDLSALEAITRPCVTLGENVSLSNGPSVALDSDDGGKTRWEELDHTVLAYMKARGQQQDVNLHGCILTERSNENGRFYGADVTQMDILAGNVPRHVEETRSLFEVIKLAEGRSDYDRAVVESTAVEPAPGDALIASPKSTNSSLHSSFGLPKLDDPDPFGVLALEMAGLEIRQAGTSPRAASSQMELNASCFSPASSRFDRRSIDTTVSRSNRASVRSAGTARSHTTDTGTQTDAGTSNTPETTPSPGRSEDGKERTSGDRTLAAGYDVDDVDYTTADLSPLTYLLPPHPIAELREEGQPTIPLRIRPKSGDASSSPPVDDEVPKTSTAQAGSDDEVDSDTNDADDEDDVGDSDDEEHVVFEVAQAQPTRTNAIASRMIQAKGSVVTIPKRIPPPLPVRSPARHSRSSPKEAGADGKSVRSPLRQAFGETDLHSDVDQAHEGPAQEDEGTGEASTSVDPHQDHSSAMGKSDGVHPAEIDAQLTSTEDSFPPVSSINAILALEDKRALERTGDEADQHDHGSHALFAREEDLASKLTRSVFNEANSEYDSTTEDDVSSAARGAGDALDALTDKKHASSIYTGLTEDRWSMDRSSLTTPTSDRPVSVAEYTTEDDTSRKMSREGDVRAEKHNQNRYVHEKFGNTSAIAIAST